MGKISKLRNHIIYKSTTFGRKVAVENLCLRSKMQHRNILYKAFRNAYPNAPEEIRKHRNYFSEEKRGFGEDAFHYMWFRLFSEFDIRKAVEIGVYRGQVITLWALLGRMLKKNIIIHAISPFDSSNDEVSRYREIDYLNDVKTNFEAFNLGIPNLHKGFSTDPSMINLVRTGQWDLAYIDGSHDYRVVKTDYENCTAGLKKGGLLVLDDSALFTDFTPPYDSFAGHPGPSRVANEIDPARFKEILSVGHNRVFLSI